MPSPFRTNPSLGPNLHQVVPANGVWFDPANIISPKLGDRAVGDDGRQYVFVRAASAIAALTAGREVQITEPAMTAATGTGGFLAPPAGVASGAYFWARKNAL